MIHPNILKNHNKAQEQLKQLNEKILLAEENLATTTMKDIGLLYDQRKKLKIHLAAIEKTIALKEKQLIEPKTNIATVKPSVAIITPGQVRFFTKENKGLIGRSAKANFSLYDFSKRKPGFYLHSATPGGALVYTNNVTDFTKALALTFSQYYKRTSVRFGAVVVAPVKGVNKTSRLGSFLFRDEHYYNTQLLKNYFVVLERYNKTFKPGLTDELTLTAYREILTYNQDCDLIVFQLSFNEDLRQNLSSNTNATAFNVINIRNVFSYFSPNFMVKKTRFFKLITDENNKTG